MKLKIKKMNGDTFSLEVGDADSVMALKAQIKERECVDEARQRLIYHGRVLKDEDLLSSYSIAEEGTIHLVLRPEGVPPQAAANAASPAPLDQSAQAVLPLQNIGNGVLMGSVTLDANAMHNSDLTAIMSQLFSTLGNAATAQPAAEPPQAAQSALGAPQALTHRVRRIAPFRATLEESVVQADVVTSVSRGFALGGSAPPSRPYTSSAHDLDSANDSLAVAEALVSLSEALEAVQTPIGCIIGNFRAGDPSSTRIRTNQMRQTEQLRYLLSRVAVAANAMADSLQTVNTCMSRSSHVLPVSGLINAGTSDAQHRSNEAAPSSIDLDEIDVEDEDDIDAGLTLPPLDTHVTEAAPQSAGGLGFLNTLIPAVLNAAVGAFAPQLQRSLPIAAAVPPPMPQFTGISPINSTNASNYNTLGLASTSSNVQHGIQIVEGRAPVPIATADGVQVTSAATTPVHINIIRRSDEPPTAAAMPGQPERRVIRVVHQHNPARGGSGGSLPVSHGIRFVHRQVPSGVQPVMVHATAVGPNVTTAAGATSSDVLPTAHAPTMHSIQTSSLGVGPNSLPHWVQQVVTSSAGFPRGLSVRHVSSDQQNVGNHAQQVVLPVGAGIGSNDSNIQGASETTSSMHIPNSFSYSNNTDS